MVHRGSGEKTLPWFVFGVFVVLTGLAAIYVWNTTRDADHARFMDAVQGTRDDIVGRLDAYVDLLTATRGLVVSDPALPREELRSYIRSLNVQRRYPGIQGIGMSLRIPREEVPRLEAEMRAAGVTSFRVWPANPLRAEVHTIVLLEPLDERNMAAMGYDMYTHPVRREAMARARDTGRPAASGRVTLVQEIDPRKQPGFLIYTPLYATGTTPESLVMRRAALVGYVYAPFRAQDLFGGIFGSQAHPEIGFEIYDSRELLYRTRDLPPDPRFIVDDALDIAGRAWKVRWISRRVGYGPALLLAGSTLAGGMIIAALLFSLLRVQLRARAEAELTAERLRESEAELQQANHAKDEFLATLSHELRTPMTSIMGWAQMLTDEELEEETRKNGVEAILRSGTLQAQLIDDLLDLSRITAGKMLIEMAPVELGPIVLAAIETVRPASQAKNMRVEWDLAPSVWVNGDARRLQQVVWNLLSNAVKFTESEGLVRVLLFGERGDAVVEVTDTGQGIEPEFMPYLFERFRQADSSSTRKHMGLGLGLAIVRHLVELHGGTIAAESKGVGRGATFRVRLPLMRRT